MEPIKGCWETPVERTARNLRMAEEETAHAIASHELVLREDGHGADREATIGRHAAMIKECLERYGDALLKHHLAVEKAKKKS